MHLTRWYIYVRGYDMQVVRRAGRSYYKLRSDVSWCTIFGFVMNKSNALRPVRNIVLNTSGWDFELIGTLDFDTRDIGNEIR
jgi:hypothetical protein